MSVRVWACLCSRVSLSIDGISARPLCAALTISVVWMLKDVESETNKKERNNSKGVYGINTIKCEQLNINNQSLNLARRPHNRQRLSHVCQKHFDCDHRAHLLRSLLLFIWMEWIAADHFICVFNIYFSFIEYHFRFCSLFNSKSWNSNYMKWTKSRQ